MRIAITGGTGFVGSNLIAAARRAGHHVTALTRRGGADGATLRWVPGALDDETALTRLCAGADAVIHVAGVINAPTRAAFDAGNVAGTAAVIAAAERAGVSRFVHVSSLAAREPDLSAYGASKAAAEPLVRDSGLSWAAVRPPAIYGPGDREMLELFRVAKTRVMPLPPGGRVSIIHVADLCDLLLTLAHPQSPAGVTLDPDDGREGGWTHPQLARAIGGAVGRRVLPLPLPRAVLRGGAAVDGLLRGAAAKLTPDRVRYFCHPDWVAHRRPDPALWRPAIATRAGLAATARWYREQGWL